MASYICFEMKRRETGETVYRNSWITDKPVTEEKVGRLASCGRPRRDFLVFITADEDRE
jgi:hypothetical protein